MQDADSAAAAGAFANHQRASVLQPVVQSVAKHAVLSLNVAPSFTGIAGFITVGRIRNPPPPASRMAGVAATGTRVHAASVKTLLILNDAPYSTEHSYNGLRLALALARQPETELHIFLMADAAFCAKRGQNTPDGYYNVERMLRGLLAKGATVGCCGTCMDARGLTEEELIDGARRSSMAELADWTVRADKVLTW